MTESHADTAQHIDPGLARAINSYVPTDSYFGRPFIDADEMRDAPLPHRYIHGGFENSEHRFATNFPERDGLRGRFFPPLSGGSTEERRVWKGVCRQCRSRGATGH